MIAQPVLETGGREMPSVWIDKDTRHKIIKLTRFENKNSLSFYFHNNPFIGNKMIFYCRDKEKTKDIHLSNNPQNIQLFLLDLTTLETTQLTYQSSSMSGEIANEKTGMVYYQIKDSVFGVNVNTRESKLVFVFPDDFKGNISTVNATGTLLAGTRSDEKENEIFKKNPSKKDYFNLVYNARLPRTLFTINISTGKLDKIFTDSAWLNHVQFSPTDSALLLFCHEGPWQKVDRIWTIDIHSKKIIQIHHRVMDMEIAGHEWFSKDGNTIWYDSQQPKGKNFFVEGYNIKTGQKKKYSLQRDEWSVHYNQSNDVRYFCGDGGDSAQVAKAVDGKWIYLFTPAGDKFIATKLVNMKNHHYRLEPNVHFTPDEKWIIFRANFEGVENIYAVEVEETKL